MASPLIQSNPIPILPPSSTGVDSLWALNKTDTTNKPTTTQAASQATSQSRRSAVAKAVARTYRPYVPKEKDMADKVLEFFSTTGPIQTSLQGLNQSVQSFGNVVNGRQLPSQVNEKTYRALKYQYANLYVETAVGEASNLLGKASTEINQAVEGATAKITDTLKPVSSFVGSTLYTLTGVMKNPIGSVFTLPNTVASMMNSVNPSLAASFTASYKKFNVEKLAEMPGQLFGNIQQMVKTIDGMLAVPIGLVNDVYRGFMDLMGQINDFINGVMEAMTKAFQSIINQLVPGLSDFLNQVTVFANQIGGITQIFSGSNQILGFTNQLIEGTNFLNGFIQNPLDVAFSFAPPEISQGLYVLQNPQQLLNNFLPPQLTEIFAKFEQISGFGFNGNMGFGLQSVLEGLQGGVLSSILQGFATQFSILSPLFTGQSVPPPNFANETSTATTPDGTTYNVDKTTGAVLQTNPPRPNYGP
jgi:hypothetical protein